MCCLDPESPDHSHDESEPSEETNYAPAWLVELAKSPGRVPPWAVELARSQAVLAAQQRETSAILQAMLDKIDEIGGAIKPTVEAISNHPMGKMFGLGAKR
jgi:membrane-bound ClpP family serine protease